jgi:hypothetical protein
MTYTLMDDDAFALATSEIVVACTSGQRWFDLDAVRTDYKPQSGAATQVASKMRTDPEYAGRASGVNGKSYMDGAGAPPLDWWKDPWPVVRDRLTAAMCPLQVCRDCGEPRRRITEPTEAYAEFRQRKNAGDRVVSPHAENVGNRAQSWDQTDDSAARGEKTRTVGWTSCGHDNYRTGITLDPFDLTESSNVPAHYIVSDVFDALAAMPDGSVDLILTSPPFLALRSYLPADHPDKAKEIGSEATPADFIDTLLDLTVEWRRVLAPHGSICIELGDTYAGSGGAGGDYGPDGLRDGQPKFRQMGGRGNGYSGHKPDTKHGDAATQSVPLNAGVGWPLSKSLCMIPELYRLSLGYGRNILRPERIIEPWRVRNVVRWCRPNPPVGALGDKFRPGTSDMVIACTSAQRWFDLDSVRHEPFVPKERSDSWAKNRRPEPITGSRADDGQNHASGVHPAGAPPLDWWQVSTEPYAGSHYATWPRKLLTRPILAMCPLQVCRDCGEPRRRITESVRTVQGGTGEGRPMSGSRGDPRTMDTYESSVGTFGTIVTTLGWTSCGHDNYRTGITLDPFAGSGTTLAVATGHGRDAIGIDLDERNLELARERVGPMFFTEGSPFPTSPGAVA